MPTESKENQAPQRPPPIKRTSLFAKLLALALIALAAWLAWYSYRQGELPDLSKTERREEIMAQARKDFGQLETKVGEASREAKAWAERSMDDLRKLINGNPPVTIKEVSQLVNESKRPPSPSPPLIIEVPPSAHTEIPPPPPTKSDLLLAQAHEEYDTGLTPYKKTDPSNPWDQVQASLREAMPHFQRCLDKLEDARKNGGSGAGISNLEREAAKRLFDCQYRTRVRQ